MIKYIDRLLLGPWKNLLAWERDAIVSNNFGDPDSVANELYEILHVVYVF